MKTSPLKSVMDRFGDKAKLVAAVKGLATPELWLARVNEARGLESVSNAKLLRLHDTLARVKKDFGSRGKLIDAILALTKRTKDAGMRDRLEKFPTPRLVDIQTSAARKAKAPAGASAKGGKKAAAAKPEKKKKARSKKAKAKAAAAAKK